MVWVWTTVGSLGLLCAAVCFAAAVPVYLSAPRRLPNRLLGLYLWVFGLGTLGGAALMYLTDDAAGTYAWQIVNTTFQVASIPLYVAFLSTVPGPLARAVARARPALYVVAAAAPVFVLVGKDLFWLGVAPGRYSPWDSIAGPGFLAFSATNAVTGLFGLAVAVNALVHTTRGTAARAQAIAYLAAFACLDLGSVSYLGYLAFPVWPVWLLVLQIALATAFVLLLAYGVLRTQLFDIDLKVKWTLRRGTVATVFLAAFVVATTIAEQYLEQYGALVGGAAAGLLVFAFRPIERAADRLADRAMPRVQDTTEYRTVRKREVYRAAVESAMEDGAVTERERSVLATLADQLGLTARETFEIERQAHAARAQGAA